MRSVLRLAAILSLLGLIGSSGRVGAREGPSSFDDLFDRGLALFTRQEFRKAQAVLQRAHRLSPDDAETDLLLGISYYRTQDYDRAQPLLSLAVRRGDPDTQASARVFLGLIYQAQGAPDQAREELLRAGSQSHSLRASAQDLVQGLQQHILSASLIISPEVDGNVQLTDHGTWLAAPGGSTDGDVLLLASLLVRPLQRIGLYVGNTLSYRQQFRFQDYNLLLDTATAGYNYLGERHRVRVAGSFSYAMLGGSPLYLDGGGRAAYRLRLWSKLSASLSYEGHYRGYRQPSYVAFSGGTHTLAAELSWGTSPSPLTVSLGYQAIREQLIVPPPTTLADGTTFQEDFRAWAHGPLLRLRAQLSRRLELGLSGAVLRRIFDYVSPQSGRRLDVYAMGDASLTVSCQSWLDFFVGSTLIYNGSTDQSFSYVKPTGYLGLAASFSVF